MAAPSCGLQAPMWASLVNSLLQHTRTSKMVSPTIFLIEIYPSGLWNDNTCTNPQGYIVEYESFSAAWPAVTIFVPGGNGSAYQFASTPRTFAAAVALSPTPPLGTREPCELGSLQPDTGRAILPRRQGSKPLNNTRIFRYVTKSISHCGIN